jgi:hypothetical protein
MWFYSTTTKKSNHAVNQPGISAMLSDLKSHYNLISRFYLTTLLNFYAPPASLQGGKKAPLTFHESNYSMRTWNFLLFIHRRARARARRLFFFVFYIFPPPPSGSPLFISPPNPLGGLGGEGPGPQPPRGLGGEGPEPPIPLWE